jgi:hypothetical protein
VLSGSSDLTSVFEEFGLCCPNGDDEPSVRHWCRHIPLSRGRLLLHKGACDESCKIKITCHDVRGALSGFTDLAESR